VRFLRFALRTPVSCGVLLFGAVQAPPLAAAEQSGPPYASPVRADTDDANRPLTMDEAARLSLVDQPLLTGREAKIQAEEHQAIAAAQLPDPQLSGGIKELPIDTSEAFSTVVGSARAWRSGAAAASAAAPASVSKSRLFIAVLPPLVMALSAVLTTDGAATC